MADILNLAPSFHAIADLPLYLALAAPVFMLAPWLWHVLGQGASWLLFAFVCSFVHVKRDGFLKFFVGVFAQGFIL